MWIATFLHTLPLDLAFRRWPEALQANLRSTTPLAITESKRVRWVSTCAEEFGIVPGMTETGALTRAANLVLVPRDVEAEEQAVIESALWALHFSPQVALRPFGLLMDVTASLRLFGGTAAIVGHLRNGLSELGLSAHIAAAPTATAAWWLAQWGDNSIVNQDTYTGAIDVLPVMAMESLAPHADTLKAVGCQTVGQFRRLPRTGITKRFGKAALIELDRAFGGEPELMAWYEPPETFCKRMELGARVETTELLLGSARRLLMQMTGYLAARHSAVTRFSLLLHHETVRHGKSPTTRVDIKLGAPNRDLEHLTLLMKEHLGKVVLESSVIELTLSADDLVLSAAPNTELFPTAASQSEFLGRLIERMNSRLGPDAVKRLSVSGDHRPEHCSRELPVATSKLPKAKNAVDGTEFPPRPTWLLKKPIKLLTRQNKPFYHSPLTLLIGPERIETGWWDDDVIARDYFVATNAINLVLWVYRERISVDDDEPGWFLHGFFA